MASNLSEMIDSTAKLREKRDFLEERLKEKYAELTKICIREAELTGRLPVETPFQDDGTMPKFRPVLRSLSLNSDDFYRLHESNNKKLEVVSKKNGRVKGSPKKSRIRTIWETLPSLTSRNSDSSLSSLPLSSEKITWPHRTSPLKSNRSRPYFIQKKT